MLEAFIKIGFIEFDLIDLLDVFLVSILLYQVYRLLKGNIAYNIFLGFLLFFLLFIVVNGVGMELLSTIMGQFIGVGMIALLIVFQPEIRRFLLFLGRGSNFERSKFLESFLGIKKTPQNLFNDQVKFIIRAINNLASNKLGALIVFTTTSEKMYFANTGEKLNSNISSRILESIFQKKSPLHDGAVIIANNSIYAAACVLPVSENPLLPARVGMRHKAAAGISEQIECIVIIVSEETGYISSAKDGKLKININKQSLFETVKEGLVLVQ